MLAHMAARGQGQVKACSACKNIQTFLEDEARASPKAPGIRSFLSPPAMACPSPADQLTCADLSIYLTPVAARPHLRCNNGFCPKVGSQADCCSRKARAGLAGGWAQATSQTGQSEDAYMCVEVHRPQPSAWKSSSSNPQQAPKNLRLEWALDMLPSLVCLVDWPSLAWKSKCRKCGGRLLFQSYRPATVLLRTQQATSRPAGLPTRDFNLRQR